MQLNMPTKRPSIRNFARLMNRRSRSGQSIIIVALAFIALIAFVGIATDVALLFVRYSTLSRAVDAAAIAAAGQIRENATYLTLDAIAQQFIQAHGINPSSVKVETCETEADDLIKAGLQPDYVHARQARIDAGSDLCKDPPQKLVRVSAQLQSDTTFLSLLGWKTVTLVSSAVSQTASLDVALVLDTSLSEAFDTASSEVATSSGSLVYPCGVSGGPQYTTKGTCVSSGTDNSDALRSYHYFTNSGPTTSADESTDPTQVWGLGLQPFPASPEFGSFTSDTNKSIDAASPTGPYPYSTDPTVTKPIRYECWWSYKDYPYSKADYGWAGCCNDPTTQSDSNDASNNPQQGYLDTSTGVYTPHAVTPANEYYNPTDVSGLNPDPNWYVYDPGGAAESAIQVTGHNPFTATNAASATVLSGLPDGNRSDLVCRPFKDVRDAARRFIDNLDFTRGDRVALVTFDSGQSIKVPFGSTVAMLDDQDIAISTLNQQVGVEVNPRHNQQGYCASVSDPIRGPDTAGDQSDVWFVNPAGADPSTTDPNQYLDVNQPLNLFTYWTVAQCPDTNTGGGILEATAALVNPNWIRRDAVWVMIILSDGYPNRTPSVYSGGILDATHPSTSLDPLDNQGSSNDWDSWFQLPVTGSAGESDIFTNASKYTLAEIQTYCNPYSDPPSDQNINTNYGQRPEVCSSASARALGYNLWGQQSTSFGFCPWWTFCDLLAAKSADLGHNGQFHSYSSALPVTPTRMPQCVENDPQGIWQATSTPDVPNEGSNSFGVSPACSDNDPNSRHFCQDGNGLINPTAAENANPSDYYCDPHYDADDYARDRADFAGLINYMDKSTDASGNPTGPALKGNFIAMYSIFFAHTTSATTAPLGANILGVKFMHYVADVGDDGIIENHLQKWYRDTRDGVVPWNGTTYSWRNPPTGLNEANVQLVGSPTDGSGVTTYGASVKVKPVVNGGIQPTPPEYDGEDNNATSVWVTTYGYAAEEDPCALYDYNDNQSVNVGDLPGVPVNDSPNSVVTPNPAATGQVNYEALAQQDCGQYYYANSPTKVNKAFTDIASRLFTRLSR